MGLLDNKRRAEQARPTWAPDPSQLETARKAEFRSIVDVVRTLLPGCQIYWSYSPPTEGKPIAKVNVYVVVEDVVLELMAHTGDVVEVERGGRLARYFGINDSELVEVCYEPPNWYVVLQSIREDQLAKGLKAIKGSRDRIYMNCLTIPAIEAAIMLAPEESKALANAKKPVTELPLY